MTSTGPSRPSKIAAAHGQEPNGFLRPTFEEKPLWTGLYESLRDTLFPPQLPPLELTSAPIPVPDRMAIKTNPWAIGTATIVNGSILALVLSLGLKAVINQSPKPMPSAHVDLSDFNLLAPMKANAAKGGGGGGSNDLIDPMQGRLPKLEKNPLTPPLIQLFDHPKLAIDPAIAVQPDVKLPDNPNLPNIGVHSSPNVTMESDGPGSHGGIGAGDRGGLGPGTGIGFGLGADQNAGGGIYTPGGGITNPIPLVTPEAEFSDEARRAKYQGICMIAIIVDARGYPQNPRVIRSLGMGLDEKALEAVRQYRFKPALKDGRPVPVRITVSVNFRLY
jgi:protein TonB